MKVIVAKTAGFCKGVKDAIEITLEAAQKRKDGERICTYGPLIHNRQVLAMLEEKGIGEENDVEKLAGKKVVIRAHGIPPDERQKLHGLGATLLDATCKRVAKVHAAIKMHARRGYNTVIVGDADHAEVIGLLGYTEGRGRVVNRPEQIDDLPENWDKVLLVAQTTQNEEVFESIREHFLKHYPDGVVKNTICGSTHERQAEVRQMSRQVEAMVVVGGHHSGNTLRLAEVARDCAIPTYHIETEADLNRQEMARYAVVGVSAGASTPGWIIKNVVQFLESIQPEQPDVKYKLKRTLGLLAYGNIFAALGAALLTSAGGALTGLPVSLADSVMAALYVFAMHSLNIYLDRSAIQLNDPGRAAFYQRWRFVFTAASVAAVLASLYIAVSVGFLTFLMMSVMIILGLLYAVPVIIPARWQGFPALKIKDIPNSKTFSIPVAWATVTILVPHLPNVFQAAGTILYAFGVVFLLVLVRTVLLDLLAVRGDRLVGKETLVVSIGEKKTTHVAKWMLAALGAALLLGPIAGFGAFFSFLVLPAVAAYCRFLRMCIESNMKEDPIFETMIESVLIGTGILALFWRLLFGP